ncbi:MAG: energy-coupling factor transporter transmembrane protein EcfT [Spirochaetales bacterium]|nr:energy-coupling factor transporter transmembrane protein EcfT [Spirochaetales bacterium]
MKELDFSRMFTLGQYLPGTSPLHRLTPQVKLIGIILLTAGLLVTSPVLGTLAGIGLLIILSLIAGIPMKFLFRNALPVLPFLILIALLQLFFTVAGNSPVLYSWGRFTITGAGVLNSLAIFLRFFALMGLLTLFTAVTPSREIGHGTENLTMPLARIGFPAHAFSLIITITFRFIPLLTEETESIMKAQTSRGARIGTAKNPVKRIISYMPILVPLFTASLQRAEQLAEAMEARCFRQGEERTRYVTYRYTLRDGIALGVSILFFGLFLLFRLGQWERVFIQ